jgi:hypothetical protein
MICRLPASPPLRLLLLVRVFGAKMADQSTGVSLKYAAFSGELVIDSISVLKKGAEGNSVSEA